MTEQPDAKMQELKTQLFDRLMRDGDLNIPAAWYMTPGGAKGFSRIASAGENSDYAAGSTELSLLDDILASEEFREIFCGKNSVICKLCWKTTIITTDSD